MLFTINLSRISVHKVYTANTVDAGALAGASQLAFAYDQMVYASFIMYQSYSAGLATLEGARDEFMDAWETCRDMYNTARDLANTAAGVACIPYVGKGAYRVLLAASMHVIAAAGLMLALYVLPQYTKFEAMVKQFYEDLQDSYDNTMENLDNNFEFAEDIARDYAFLNSGVSEYLSDDLDINGNPIDADGDGEKDAPSQADEFSFFIQDDDTPDTFCWRDGRQTSNPISGSSIPGGINCQQPPYAQIDDSTSNRLHIAQVSVSDEDGVPDTFEVIKTQSDSDEIDDDIVNGYVNIAGAAVTAGVLFKVFGDLVYDSQSVPTCPGWHVYICIPYDSCWCIIPASCIGFAAGTAAIMYIADQLLATWDLVNHYVNRIWDGIQMGDTFCVSSEDDIGDTIPITITDVDTGDDYEIEVETFQEHQGEDLGLWQIKYPRFKSNAKATFACDTSLCSGDFSKDTSGCDVANCGDICNHSYTCMNGMNPCMGHNPSLVEIE
jgi:hypothetical protein